MWQPGWEGSLGENGYLYMYGWIPLLSTWNYHSIVNQLYPNIKQKSLIKKKKDHERDICFLLLNGPWDQPHLVIMYRAFGLITGMVIPGLGPSLPGHLNSTGLATPAIVLWRGENQWGRRNGLSELHLTWSRHPCPLEWPSGDSRRNLTPLLGMSLGGSLIDMLVKQHPSAHRRKSSGLHSSSAASPEPWTRRHFDPWLFAGCLVEGDRGNRREKINENGCLSPCVCVHVCACTRVCVCVQLCPTHCDPMDCSPPGSSVHAIFQARILEWVAISPYFTQNSFCFSLAFAIPSDKCVSLLFFPECPLLPMSSQPLARPRPRPSVAICPLRPAVSPSQEGDSGEKTGKTVIMLGSRLEGSVYP